MSLAWLVSFDSSAAKVCAEAGSPAKAESAAAVHPPSCVGSEAHSGKRSGRNTLTRKKSEELRAKLFRVDDEFVEIVFDDARGDFLLDDAELSFSEKPEARVEGDEVKMISASKSSASEVNREKM